MSRKTRSLAAGLLLLVACRDAREWDADGDGFDAAVHGGTDCDDRVASINPAATERCNGVDDNCDERIDDADPALDASSVRAWYVDRDGDGDGDANGESARASCSAPAGHAATASDCDDSDPGRHPGVVETCDGVDQDCNGLVDDVSAGPTWLRDIDGDGFGTGEPMVSCDRPLGGWVTEGGDCDDARPEVHPGAAEFCNDRDDDCDGDIDDADVDSQPMDAGVWFPDDDGDGFGRQADGRVACKALAAEVADGGDCDDDDAQTHPGAPELCDLSDNDCDGAEDEDPQDGALRFSDNDLDGFGVFATGVRLCEESPGFVADAGDCADALPAVNPGAQEICDQIDNDCDGAVDGEDDSLSGDLFQLYADEDQDGFGVGSTPTPRCFETGAWSTKNGDCDDSRDDVNPDQIEACGNGRDDDCVDQSALCALDGNATLAFEFAVHEVVGSSRTGRPTFGHDVQIADLDQDGHDELVVLTSARNATVVAVAGPLLPGVSSEPDHTPIIDIPANTNCQMDIADLDLDGLPDIVLSDNYVGFGHPSQSFGRWSVLGPFDERRQLTLDDAENIHFGSDGVMVVPDLSGDDLPDVLDMDRLWGPTFFNPVLSKGTAAWCVAKACAPSLEWWNGLQLGQTLVVDIDQDGLPDLVTSGNPSAAIFAGPLGFDGTQAPTARVYGPNNIGVSLHPLLDDLDGDNVREVLVTERSTGAAWIASADQLFGAGDRVLTPKWTLQDVSLDRVLVIDSPWAAGDKTLLIQDGGTLLLLDPPTSGVIRPHEEAKFTLELPGEAFAVGATDLDRDGVANVVLALPGGATDPGRLLVLYSTTE